MTPRERVLTALNHEEPDRVPLFIGTSGATTVLGAGYQRLKDHLGITGGPERWLSGAMQYVWMDEDVLVRLGSDGRPVVPGPAEGTLNSLNVTWLNETTDKVSNIPAARNALQSEIPPAVRRWRIARALPIRRSSMPLRMSECEATVTSMAGPRKSANRTARNQDPTRTHRESMPGP